MLFDLPRFSTHSAAALVLAAGLTLSAAAPTEAAGLLSPKDGSAPSLTLQDHHVTVVIEDGYAITRIDQVFANPHGNDFEAVYSFPVPENAAVSEFTYWIDGKPVSGEVLPKDEARAIYESEKSAGRETAITEQDSYCTFDISVWPVRAGQDVRVRLGYMQPVHMDTGIGRYVYPLEEGGVDENRNAFWNIGDTVAGSFSFDMTLRPAYPIEGLRLPAHPTAQIDRAPNGNWRVRIGNPSAGAPIASAGDTVVDEVITEASVAEGAAAAPVPQAPSAVQATRLDTDILVYWKLQDGLPAGLDIITHKPEGARHGTFMMVLTPGDDFAPIQNGRDWVFVLDVSGSMQAKFAMLQDGVIEALRRMGPEDRFRFVTFSNVAKTLPIPGGDFFTAATPDAVERAKQALRGLRADGGTNLYAGLAHGLTNLDADRGTGVVLVTDGVANVGETHRRSLIDLVEKQDVRLFTMVMGNSANRPLLDSLSDASGGTAISVSNSDDVVGAVLSATSKLTHAALHDVAIDITGVEVSNLSASQIGSLYRGEQLVVFGHYAGEGEAEVALTGKLTGAPTSYDARVTFPAIDERNPEIERLWAFATIEGLLRDMDLFGPDADAKQAVVDLATEHGLVTPFTSMLVVRDERFQELGIQRTNQERLARETTAETQRAAQPVVVRTAPPTGQSFGGNRASHGSSGGATGSGSTGGGSTGGGSGGAGSIDALTLLLMLLALGAVAPGVSRGVIRAARRNGSAA